MAEYEIENVRFIDEDRSRPMENIYVQYDFRKNSGSTNKRHSI